MDKAILYKYFNNEATEAEVDVLFAWIEAAPRNRQEFIQLKTAWALTSEAQMDASLLKNQRPQLKPKQSRTKIWRYAAVFLVLLGGALTWYASRSAFEPKTENAIVLEVSQDDSYTLKKEQPVLITAANGMQVAEATAQQITYEKGADSTQILPQRITVPYGKTYKVLLADGSQVYLNAGSTLEFPNVFTGATREVRLTGEGFFDVAKNPQKPFQVHTGPLTVAVLGTRFNVKAYAESGFIETALEEGSVGLHQNKIHKSGMVLIPGELASYNRNTQEFTKKAGNIEQEIAWIYGELLLDNTPCTEILKKLERHYNVKIHNHYPQLAQQSFSGAVKLDLGIEQLLQVLQLDTDFVYEIHGQHITLTKPNTNH
ncbi:FecR family protein [Leeuwenhoekiella aestuarii]|uniref:FecR family protein n=1 Tax=Leeuwenhoekiella aestuarii TaxID=2249426 RepID=UPI000FFF5A47|nr:FecR domain-containing protein [Leeuwenhoekiella aestuarii]RXG12873.1 FecR family protein [Leeuwenhoekiella aestuarii]